MTRSFLFAVVLSTFVPTSLWAQRESANTPREYWIGAVDPVVQRDRKIKTPADYMELFQPPTRWPTLAAKTTTLEISTQYIIRGTPQEHQALREGLKRNHLQLAGQFGVEERPNDPKCPQFEGQGGPNNAAGVAKAVHDLGLPLDYLNMDEPVTFGLESPRNPDPLPVDALAETAARKVADYKRYFPSLKCNLIDAVGGRPDMVRNEIGFVDELGKRGVHIEFFIADVQWASDWKPVFEELAVKLHARHIKVGFYCDGMLSSHNDLQWNHDSVANARIVGSDAKISPDLFMIGSWSPFPMRVFPENEPGTLTHIGKELMTMFP